MTISLRDYQHEAIAAVVSAAEAGISRQLISLPTGSGKTVIMAALAKQLGKRTLILAHRQELITQTVDKFKLVAPDIDVGICRGELDEIHHPVVVGSVQSCSRPKRLERLKQQGFELLMIDEAHHSVAGSYQAVINSLGFGHGSGNAGLLLGVSATCDRAGLGDIFEEITFSRSISTMISSGYLSQVAGRKIITNFTLEKIRTQSGDFALSDLSEAVNTIERNQFIVSKFQEYAPSRKTVAFCCDVRHAKDLAASFQAQGVDCEPVWGNMPPEDRKGVLEGLKYGRVQVVTSCGVLVEGFDEPSISCVIMARPTKSRSLYVQSVGRGLRIHPGKENCLVLDFSDQYHRLDSAVSLACIIPTVEIEKDADEDDLFEDFMSDEIDRSAKIEAFEEIDREFDLLGRSNFIWCDLGGDEWSLQDDHRFEIVMCPKDGGHIATLYHPDGEHQEVVSKPLPLAYCQGCCEDFARKHLKLNLSDATSPWMKERLEPTQSQRAFLEKEGQWDDSLTKAKAVIKIRNIIALKNKQKRIAQVEPATDAQKYFLKKNGYECDGLTKRDAQIVISKLKQKVGCLS